MRLVIWICTDLPQNINVVWTETGTYQPICTDIGQYFMDTVYMLNASNLAALQSICISQYKLFWFFTFHLIFVVFNRWVWRILLGCASGFEHQIHIYKFQSLEWKTKLKDLLGICEINKSYVDFFYNPGYLPQRLLSPRGHLIPDSRELIPRDTHANPFIPRDTQFLTAKNKS